MAKTTTERSIKWDSNILALITLYLLCVFLWGDGLEITVNDTVYLIKLDERGGK